MAGNRIQISNFGTIDGVAAQMRFIYRQIRKSIDIDNLSVQDGKILVDILKTIAGLYRDTDFERKMKLIEEQLLELQGKSR